MQMKRVEVMSKAKGKRVKKNGPDCVLLCGRSYALGEERSIILSPIRRTVDNGH